jgi:hypothetical protein
MATHTLSPPRPGRDPHRLKAGASPVAVDHSLGKGEVERPFLSALQRARIEAEVERLIALLDAADAPFADMEPDHEGEAEPDEASAQPATLAPDRVSAQVIAFPRRLRVVQVTA